ncbi:up-regulator of cell proliferation-like [Bufo bufo]|uniref:up-regulator of cell proliferation-like n=1 Tax=Bufo bufo TaxID=8384 RepID=UPI001ABE3A62|nr:up-regulator of cell proliferation-like [Bufo bufo]XP_040296047.1 up-regulator of cell proliferation-like [Bufo bufo]
MDCLLSDLRLEEYKETKLSLEHVMCITKENEDESSAQASLPWNFLRKLIALDETARNTMTEDLEDANLTGFSTEDDLFGIAEMSPRLSSNAVHPLDVLCALLYCSDSFLQQFIFSKMSMCQFAVPLVLPAGENKPYTFLLWPMRNIIKKWSPISLLSSKGFREENLVNISMPTFSFVRLGNCSLSKSKILNTVLSPSYTHHDFFVHQDIECGYRPRTISEGLLELFWYFPSGSQCSVFHEPMAVMNLRGDLESSQKQFSLLTKVSSAVFIFSESLQEKHLRMLESFVSDNQNLYFIISLPNDKQPKEETKILVDKLITALNLNMKHILLKDSRKNEAEIVKEIQNLIRGLTKASPKSMTLEETGLMAQDLEIFVDENVGECQRAKKVAKRIVSEITDVPQYKKQTMILQGDLWKKITKNEKELCRMRKLSDLNVETYRSELKGKIMELRRQQWEQELQGDLKSFLSALTDLPHAEKRYFLKWMAIFLDDIARSNLKELQTEYLKNSTSMPLLKQIDQRMSDSSLGLEHFLREVGQMHEAHCFKRSHKAVEQKFSDLPKLAADLLLDGFPLELIDGDASNIPLQWITDVLTELDKKTGGKCRMRVITVLGVQSTGKSTLLNTMFGLQFPVASGRCTRGAFMTLIKVKETFLEELGCDFIMVIDTEGLKAPELASLVDSYEHDNELATLVVGLSDITIINISMENSSEMKDILQIVVHAFLRMSKIGKKTNCHFVHQNVSDVSAHAMGIRDRRKLLEHLNQMTKAAAKMEKLEGITTFNDIMDYDLNEHTWYISGLWYGIPPMAPINTGYSEGVLSLKNYLLEFLKRKLQKPQTIPDFLEWLKSLSNAVKHEKFIFSFRNSLIADAYDQLSVKYSELEWNLRKEIYNWMTGVLISIKNESTENLTMEALIDIKQSTSEILSKEEKRMYQLMDTYFDSELENAHLVEKYREDFMKSIRSLRNELDEEIINKCREAIDIQKSKLKIEGLKDSYISKIENKVTLLLSSCRYRTLTLNDEELEAEFNSIWDDTIKGLRVKSIAKQDIDQIMLQQLRKEMSHKSGAINETLLNIKTLLEFADANFEVRDEHIDLKWYKKCQDKFFHQVAGLKEFHKEEYSFKSKQIAENLLEKSLAYVDQHLKINENYHDTFCLELLKMVNERLQQRDVKNLHTTDHFEMDLKLLILGKAAPKFQKKHDNFVNLNDPYSCLEALKSEYLSIFKAVFQEKDECKARANRFCELCLKPAIVQYVNHHLGQEIVSDIMKGADNMKYMSRTFFQLRVLCKLLEDHSFEQYVKYINNYERFVKECILEFIKEKYEDHNGLQPLRSNIIVAIFQKLRVILQNPQVQESADVSGFLRNVCKMLHKDLVISQEDLKVITFQNSVPVAQFAADVQAFLSDLEEDILSEMRLTTIESVLAVVILKPEEELFKKVIGCGKQCPFCKVPCEAGCVQHTEHFATVHRPQGLGRYRNVDTKVLCSSLCSTDVVTEKSFRNSDTDWKFHPYKDYQEYYPDWMIKPDPSINTSDYWKFIFKEFNAQFAKEYKAQPARLPKDWSDISKGQALESLKDSFHVK